MPYKPYDLFISYKSEDVHLVRRIVEALISSGYMVWFAEYQVLLLNYERFQTAISEGIRSSRFGVCFTNDRYVDSVHCRSELEQLLEPRNCGLKNIIEIMIPNQPRTREQYPQLTDAHALEHVFIEETLEHISKKVGIPLVNRAGAHNSTAVQRRVFQDGRESYSLDVQGWDVSENTCLSKSGGDLEGAKFSRWCGNFRLWGNLFVGDQVDNPRTWSGSVDDRQCYQYAIDFAKHFFYKRWWWRFVERPVGLHLLFLHGFSHIGLTAKNRFGIWTRRYSVILLHPETRVPLEFSFIFFFRGPLSEFCRHAYLIDDLVGSLVLCSRQ